MYYVFQISSKSLLLNTCLGVQQRGDEEMAILTRWKSEMVHRTF